MQSTPALAAAAAADVAAARPRPSSRLVLGFVTAAAAAATAALLARHRPSLGSGLSTRARAFTYQRTRAPATCSPPVSHRASATMSASGAAPPLFGDGDGVAVPAPAAGATAALIFLHGLGDTAHGWAAAFPLQSVPHMRVVLPTAATRPVTLNMGMRMPAWFDIAGLDASAPDDAAGIDAAVARVRAVLDALAAAGVPSTRVALAGFSQGGALALAAGLTLHAERPLAAVAALSGWLPLRDRFVSLDSPPPLFLAHGMDDPVVDFAFGQKSADALRQAGAHVKFESYAGLGHGAAPQELEDLAKFLAAALPPV